MPDGVICVTRAICCLTASRSDMLLNIFTIINKKEVQIMKKSIMVLLALLMGLGAFSLTVFAEETVLVGDTSCDGIVNSLDAAFILRHDAELITLSENGLKNGDVNFDGIVNSLDAAQVLRYDAGLSDGFFENEEPDDTPCGDAYHVVSDGVCTECGYTDKSLKAFSAVANFLVGVAPREGDTGPYSISKRMDDSYSQFVGFSYDPDSSPCRLEIFYYNDDYRQTTLTYICGKSLLDVTTKRIIGDSRRATALISVADFNADDPKVIDYTSEEAENADENERIMAEDIVIAIKALDKLLTDDDLGYTSADFGFVAF